MLPRAAGIAGDPGLARVVVLLCSAADAADHLVFGLLLLLVGGGRRLLAALALLPLRRLGRVVELVEGFRVLAFCGADGASRFGFACGVSVVVSLCVLRGSEEIVARPPSAAAAAYGVATGVETPSWGTMRELLTRHDGSRETTKNYVVDMKSTLQASGKHRMVGLVVERRTMARWEA